MLTAQQICALAMQDAKCPGYAVQAGQLLNLILAELCETYDFDVAKQTDVANFNPALSSSGPYPNVPLGGGPYTLPANYLRMVDDKSATWFLLGVPYQMKPCDLSEYDGLVQQAGNQAYPYIIATDMSQSPPVFLVWPQPSGAYQYQIRYFAQMADITNPQTSSVIPWFPFQAYLRRRLAGELMSITGDNRASLFLADDDDQPMGAGTMLRKYLKLKDDRSDRTATVKLDRRTFGKNFATLKNTKVVGW